LPREELTARIIAARHRIDHAYALSAMMFADGRISLDNGLHRWAVAVELGIKRVPVEMIYESPEPAWAWG
jgi:ParB-like chromosome segregation protein Spo0J